MSINALVPELSVRSISNSLRFYAETLGFHILYQRPEDGFAFIAIGDAQIMLDQIDKGRTFDQPEKGVLGLGLNLQINVPDIAPLLENLQAASIPLYLPVEEKWYRRGTEELGNRQFVVRDPDGYLLRFFEDMGTRPTKPTSL